MLRPHPVRALALAGAGAISLLSLAAPPPASARAAGPGAGATVVVRYRPGIGAIRRRDARRAAGAGAVVGSVRGQGARIVRAAGDPAVVARRLARDPAVLYAEPNALMHATATPDDPLFGRLGGLRLIGAAAAWDALGLGSFPISGGVPVGIVDTGIDAAHEDLAGKPAACGAVRDGHVSAGSCADANGHGTHVAGTVGAIANNGVGVAGVAFASPLVVCRALGPDGSGTLADVASCISWVHARGARVISLSLGGPSSITLGRAVASAWRGGRAGGSLIVAAAGNDGDDRVEYPAGLPEVVSVAAVDAAGAHASFSNANPDVEVAAPGVSILSTRMGGGYVALSGTSMATPHVAGAAALLWSAHPRSAPATIRARLDAAVSDAGAPGRDPVYGFGVLSLGPAAPAAP